MNYKELIVQGQQHTQKSDVHPEVVRRYMLELTRQNGIDLYQVLDQEADPSLIPVFNAGVDRLIQQEPLAYILGFDWFYGYQIKVNEAVLIPREETEELVAYILSDIDEYFPEGSVDVADVATGSGAIAIALRKEEPRLRVYASDISTDALAVAGENAGSNDAAITFLAGDMLEPFFDQDILFDIVVCNPPYIGTHEQIQVSVYDYEPHIALFGGDDGLKFYRQLLSEAKRIIKPRSMIAFEIGYQQAKHIEALALQYFPEASIVTRRDLNGLDRMLFIYNQIEFEGI